jgi:hypothetical protein
MAEGDMKTDPIGAIGPANISFTIARIKKESLVRPDHQV